MRLLLTGFLLLFVSACAPEVIPEPEVGLPELSTDGTRQIDAFLAGATATGQVPKAVAIVANREAVLYEGAFGKQSVADDMPAGMDSIFNLASMTKPVTSVAVMMLAEEGAFALDDAVSTYLPDWANREVVTTIDEEAGTFETEAAGSEITIRQLLAHTSGLAYNFSNATAQTLIDLTGEQQAINLPLVVQPGTVWNYSGSTAVLGDLVGEVSGQPLEEFLESRIFEPLGMEDTSYAVPDAKRDRVVTTHRLEDGELVETPVPDQVFSAVRGDGGLSGTAGDYIRFLQMLLNDGEFAGNRILSAESVAAMTANQIGSIRVETQYTTNPALSAHFPIGAGSDTFGLGFQLTSSNAADTDLRAPGSYSWAGIFNTHFWGDPERGIAAVILMQQLPFYSDDAMDVYQGFEQRVNRNLE